MTLPLVAEPIAPAVHLDIEPFHVLAHRELDGSPLVAPGVCLNPSCSRAFAPTRHWQRYCSEACRKADDAEMRKVGHKAAPALLAWRMGKYEKQDEALRALARVGRNYVSKLQSEWFNDRAARIAKAGQ